MLEIQKELEEELPNYNMSLLLQYLGARGELLDEEIREFLEEIEVLSQNDLEELLKKGLDLQVDRDPKISYY